MNGENAGDETSEVYAGVIIDISHEKVDRPFHYRIPSRLAGQVQCGTQVDVPFGRGNALRKGYVVDLTGRPGYDPGKMKEIAGVSSASVTAESRLIQLAWWMKDAYGGTMNQALRTVLPVKRKVKGLERRWIVALEGRERLLEERDEAERKHFAARVRLLTALAGSPTLPYEMAVRQLNVSRSSMEPLIRQGLIRIGSEKVERNPIHSGGGAYGREADVAIPCPGKDGAYGREADVAIPCPGMAGAYGPRVGVCEAGVELNPQQRRAVEAFGSDFGQGKRAVYLIHGITGSGKTEVYMEIIQCVLSQGKEAIVLIPEIALTYQTVLQFYRRFGDLVAIVNSRLSAGERYDQFERARRGEVRIMIGPRSALFTPFADLGLILIDEEHEGAYKSEGVPRYHAREVAEKLASMQQASLVLGSATPSLESYTRALEGRYRLFTLTERAKPSSSLSRTEIVDLREELREGNKSIFSRRLRSLMEQRLGEGEQIMLFMNRRGYSNFVSCRSCGQAIRCVHCDVSMTLHRSGELVCHYCGSRIPMPKTCPECGSPYIAAFGVGTQKLEELTKKEFPRARVLRMDLDTTSGKGGHEAILQAFAQGEADILIGTQMIVKGHDFPNVTLVGIMAADQSLYAPDYRCAERTFQLLTQAAGRAGRDEKAGDVVIQTYNPDHYSIQMAARQDYEGFYRQEMAFRRTLHYPPACHLLTVQIAAAREDALEEGCAYVTGVLSALPWYGRMEAIGPVQAPIFKVNDIYRKILYIKHHNYDILINTKNKLEESVKSGCFGESLYIQYDFS